MTFLLNSELSPAFMQDGRVSFTAEKATPDFYQLSGRRMNWDLTDYHPLLAQRAQSTDTFDDRPAALGRLPAGDGDPRGARPQLPAHPVGRGRARAAAARSPPSTVRSGPFEADRNDVTVREVDGDRRPGRDRPTAGTTGVYRSPFSLPNGEILASYAGHVADPTSATSRSTRWSPSTRRTGAGGCWPATAPLLRRGGARLQARRDGSCSPTYRSWCSAATPTSRAPPATASCTSPTSRCSPRCWAPTCAAAATSRPSTGDRAQGLPGARRPPTPTPAASRARDGLHEPDVARLGPARSATTR